MSTVAHGPLHYHHKPRIERHPEQKRGGGKVGRSFLIAGLAILGVVGGAYKYSQVESGPSTATEANRNPGIVPPPGNSAGLEGKDGGQGAGNASNNLCPWETPAIRNAAKAVVGSTTKCTPPLSSEVTGATWSDAATGTKSVRAVVEPRSQAVAPKDLRDPNKAFAAHWDEYSTGTGADTFCNPTAHKVAVYSGEHLITITMQDTLGTTPPGCSQALGEFARTVVQSGIANQG